MNTQTASYEPEQFISSSEELPSGGGRVPTTQKETEVPPQLPNFTYESSLTTNIQVRLRKDQHGNERMGSLSDLERDLWPASSYDKQVVLVPAPNSTVEYVAFGLCELVGIEPNLLEVAFVARMGDGDRGTFKTAMGTVTVHELSAPRQESLNSYLLQNYGSTRQTVAGLRQGLARMITATA
jgi:hypothetical protein